MDPPRIERGTPRCKRGILPLDYGPISNSAVSSRAREFEIVFLPLLATVSSRARTSQRSFLVNLRRFGF